MYILQNCLNLFKNIDKYGEGTAEFAAEAIKASRGKAI
jgi:hypothetical protein